MGTHIENPWAGGRGRTDLGEDIPGSGIGNAHFLFIKVGGDPPYDEGHG